MTFNVSFQNVLECLLWYQRLSKYLRKLVTVKENVKLFPLISKTKRCLIFFFRKGGGRLSLRWLCSFAFVYQEEHPSSLPSTSSELNCLKRYFKRNLSYLSFVWEQPNPISHKHEPNYLHPSGSSKLLCFKVFHDCGCWCSWLMFVKPLSGY